MKCLRLFAPFSRPPVEPMAPLCVVHIPSPPSVCSKRSPPREAFGVSGQSLISFTTGHDDLDGDGVVKMGIPRRRMVRF